uniref:Uncharacterized protein n=1 Tax=Rhizophora mucronata TaxID=61149 RepID=A0A2P2PYR4_RHIMU
MIMHITSNNKVDSCTIFQKYNVCNNLENTQLPTPLSNMQAKTSHLEYGKLTFIGKTFSCLLLMFLFFPFSFFW